MVIIEKPAPRARINGGKSDPACAFQRSTRSHPRPPSRSCGMKRSL